MFLKVVLTKPFSTDGASEADYRAPNLIQRILALFKNVRPGSDLTPFKLPPMFNLPSSMLWKAIVLYRHRHSESISLTIRRFLLNTQPKSNRILNSFGASVESEVRGNRQLKLKLQSPGETYEMNYPNLLIRFLPLSGVDWTGNVRIGCKETGFEAELQFGPKSFLGLRGSHGSWEVEGAIYNAEEVYSGLRTPVVKDLQGVEPTESAAVWNTVSKAIMSQNWEKAKEAKNTVEENQRKVLREMEAKEKTWVPQNFSLSYRKDGGWECSPTRRWVPPAPIVVPLT
ncbi:Thioredoxin superfamily protein isoform 1 [Hibiscus syriacus]|uniref:Thioredoxin superfamily protein isoform 1 n=1 Tax=Hibiscus syriacus TaxID=106335 RepID=A0A6A2XHL4_HIBSY|nr:Thioredoxin superfamily protein isoform 1 [Hibiscus syriacus]